MGKVFVAVGICLILIVGITVILSCHERSKKLEEHERLKKLEKSVDFYKRKIIALDRSTLWLNKSFSVLKEIEQFIMDKKPTNKTELIDMARWFVRNGFIGKYDVDVWYDENKYDTELVLETLYQHHLDPSSEPAHLDCQPSSRALASILNYFGFQTRLVALLTDDYDYVASHAMVEVLNPDSGKWELQDPQYNLFFYDSLTGQRVSAIDIVFNGTENIIPSNGRLHGWDKLMANKDTEKKPMLLKDHFFEMLAYRYVTRKCFVFINKDKISLTKRFPKNDNLNIIEFINKVYGNPPIFTLPPSGEYKAY